ECIIVELETGLTGPADEAGEGEFGLFIVAILIAAKVIVVNSEETQKVKSAGNPKIWCTQLLCRCNKRLQKGTQWLLSRNGNLSNNTMPDLNLSNDAPSLNCSSLLSTFLS